MSHNPEADERARCKAPANANGVKCKRREAWYGLGYCWQHQRIREADEAQRRANETGDRTP